MLHLSRCSLGIVPPSRTRGDLLRCAVVIILIVGIALLHGQFAEAQEVSFTPRFEGLDQDQKPIIRSTAVPVEQQERKIYSFARFSRVFKDLCGSLQADLRDKRVFEAGTRGLAASGNCGTCRALYRQLIQWCKPDSAPTKRELSKKATPSPAPTPTPIPSVEVSEEQQGNEGKEEQSEDKVDSSQPEELADANEQGTQSEQEDSVEAKNTETENAETETAETENAEQSPVTTSASPSPTASPTPQPARYPSTELIDAASRLSQGLYELEPGFGAGTTFEATQRLSRDLLSQKDLSPAERDYYSIFSAYLLSAWEGRPGSPLDPRVQAKEDVSELFQ